MQGINNSQQMNRMKETPLKSPVSSKKIPEAAKDKDFQSEMAQANQLNALLNPATAVVVSQQAQLQGTPGLPPQSTPSANSSSGGELENQDSTQSGQSGQKNNLIASGSPTGKPFTEGTLGSDLNPRVGSGHASGSNSGNFLDGRGAPGSLGKRIGGQGSLMGGTAVSFTGADINTDLFKGAQPIQGNPSQNNSTVLNSNPHLRTPGNENSALDDLMSGMNLSSNTPGVDGQMGVRSSSAQGSLPRSPMTVSYSSIDPSLLSSNPSLNNSNRLWFPISSQTPNLTPGRVASAQQSQLNEGMEDELSLGSLNGEFTEDLNVNSDPRQSAHSALAQAAGPDVRSAPAEMNSERVLKTNLSGSDFLNTLNSTRGPVTGLEPQPMGRGKNAGTGGMKARNSQVLGDSLPSFNAQNLTGSAPQIGVPFGIERENGSNFAADGRAKKDLNFGAGSSELKKSGLSVKSPLDDLGQTLSTTGSHLGATGVNRDAVTSGPVQVSGNVTSGAMTRERLSSEALNTLGLNIRNMAGQGGGEIRMRLRPENLGELNIRVATLGGRVELQIQASDERSKKIIEESLGYLKDSMSAQNLTLANVDLSIAHSFPSGGDLNSDSRYAQSQAGFQDTLGQQGRRGESGGNWNGGSEQANFRDRETLARPLASRIPNGIGRSYSSSNVASSGRIDVRG